MLVDDPPAPRSMKLKKRRGAARWRTGCDRWVCFGVKMHNKAIGYYIRLILKRMLGFDGRCWITLVDSMSWAGKVALLFGFWWLWSSNYCVFSITCRLSALNILLSFCVIFSSQASLLSDQHTCFQMVS